ncbi:MAG: hypothetical protein H0S80_05055 [Desulfovibrionaceae bacterium]|nr:hypothetical protein [Desulfovibrionaceae bacterium]
MITQANFENTKNPELLKSVVETVNGSSPVLGFLDFMPLNNNKFQYNREGMLPGVAYRDFNEEYAENTGVIVPDTETLYIFGGDSDVDVKMMAANGGIAYRTALDVQKAKAQGLFFTNEFFVGAGAGRISGLRNRLTGDQVLDAGSSDGGDELTLDMLDELIVSVDGEQPDVLFMNQKLWLKVNKLMRSAGQAREMVTTSFGALLPSYANIPIARIGSVQMDNPADQGTPITLDPLGFNEPDLDDGDQDVTASIYAVRFGKGEYVSGLQCGAFDVEDCGKLPGTNKERTKLDWMAGLATFHPKSAARLRGLRNV